MGRCVRSGERRGRGGRWGVEISEREVLGKVGELDSERECGVVSCSARDCLSLWHLDGEKHSCWPLTTKFFDTVEPLIKDTPNK